MKKSFGTKLLLSIIAVSGIAILGFIAYIFTALFGGLLFYAPLVGIFTIIIAIYVVLLIFKVLNDRIRLIVFLSIIGLTLVTVAGYEIKKVYDKSFTEISEPEVNLTQYAPFAERSKAAILEEPSTYHIDNKLPRLDGATALYPLYSAFAQAVYPKGNYNPYDSQVSKVICSTTPDAYRNLIAGETDIIFVAAPSQAQLKQAQLKGVELQLTPIGREAFVFFVNKKNSVTGLTSAQIKDIYSGKITNWKNVGGKNNSIRAFQRPEDSGSQTMLRNFMGNTPLMTPPKKDVADVMSGIIQQTSSYRNYKNAIGYSFLFYASEMNQDEEITLLDIDGITPNKENIRNGQYPLSSEFYAVTAGSNNPNIQPFLEWIVSPQGQELIEKTGYTSLK